MKSLKGIKSAHSEELDTLTISRKIFLSYPTEVFIDKEDDEFYIKNEISKEFQVPFSSIEICGSSKTGISFFKDRPFTEGHSDLDIAIISLPIFNKFLQESHFATNGFSDLTPFPFFRSQRTDKQFLQNIQKGFINPFYMPNCSFKDNWLRFFREISREYFKLFKNINGGVYASEYFYEYKQKENIEQYLTNAKKYDKISDSIKGVN